MKNYILILLLISLFACTTTKETSQIKPYTEFKIVNTPIIIENDTITINELQLYKIQSSLDGMKLMYQNYEKCDKKLSGKHQKNINRIVWENIKLIDYENEPFTVIADGKETMNDYFACLMVFDSNEKDYFSLDHPYKDKLTELFIKKMKMIDKNFSVYKKFR